MDGGLEARAAVVKGFIQHDPHEGEIASQETAAYLAYDQKYLYVGFVCKDHEPQKIRAHVAPRDAIGGDDHVEVIIDTYNDHRRGYAFAANPYGIQADYFVTEARGWDSNFDTVWHSEGRPTPQGYVVLMKIPFTNLRFAPGHEQTWGIMLARFIPRLNELSTWPAVSREINGWLIQEGEGRGLKDLSHAKNLQCIPYGVFSSRRFLDKGTSQFKRDTLDERLGLDAKWMLASNLTLDATVNPDFSQVESDEPQITVNRRFEVFFPEKRPFFMENSHYFDTPINVLFTRRIQDPQFGLKLTGKTGPYTIAGLVADDRGPGETVPSTNPAFSHRALFDVIRLGRDIHEQSAIGFIWSDREFMQSFNRVLGADGHWKISKTTGMNFQVLKSFSQEPDGTDKEGTGLHASLSHSAEHWNAFWGYNDRSAGFQVLSGFIPRVNYRSLGGQVGYAFRPESRWVVAWEPSLGGSVLLDHNNIRQDYSADPGFWIQFTQATYASAYYDYKRERFEGEDFLKRRGAFSFYTHGNRWFSAGLSYDWGQQINFTPAEGLPPFLGQEEDFSLRLTVRPTARLAVENSLLESRLLTLEEGRNVFNNNIFRSKLNYQFTKRFSLRLIGQYANVLPSPLLSSLDYTKNLGGDFLLTYLVHPGTAVYLGYSNVLENYDRGALAQRSALERSPSDLVSTAAGLFLKISYQYSF